jgi:hypothetical protein
MLRNRSLDMTIDDFIFMSFMRGAKLIHKQLTDKRLTNNRYVGDKRWMADLDPKYEESAKDDVVCWFKVPVGTKRSISLERWAEDCELMGLNWEIRQRGDKHWTVFLFLRNDWLYNKQIRSFSTIHRQSSMSIEQVKQESIFPKEYWEVE